jgi:hypothetical protein
VLLVNWVLLIGLLLNVIALPIVARRVVFLYRLITAGQPAPGRIEGVTGRLGATLKRQLVEVFGQRKLLKWSLPGAAHFFVFWAFVILASVYLEAYGALFDSHFAIPLIGHWALLGFLQDFIALMALAGIITFAVIRLQNSPERLGRKSRFKGSHLGGAWVVLFMIFNVIWSLFLFRGAASAPSRTSRGRACSTSRPARSAVAASRSARPGTPRSRSRPRCSSSTCATTRSRRRRTSWPPRAPATGSRPPSRRRPRARSSPTRRRTASSTPTSCGRARTAAPA